MPTNNQPWIAEFGADYCIPPDAPRSSQSRPRRALQGRCQVTAQEGETAMSKRDRFGYTRPVRKSASAAMLHLLTDGQDGHPGHIEVYAHQQWRTYFKAERLGLIDDDGDLTDKGRAFIAKASKDQSTT